MSTIRYPRATVVLVATLVVLTILAWVVTVGQVNGMNAPAGMGSAGGMGSGGMSGGPSTAGTLIDLAGTLTLAVFIPMWVAMMAAMMLPSAAPMILLFDRVSRSKTAGQPALRAAMPTVLFVGGYFLTWTVFGLVAYAVGLALGLLGAHWPTLTQYRPAITGVLLIVAGLYQLSPLKRACLKHCRSPLDFMTHHWLKGRGAAVRMGAAHGLYCVGCCWGLMLVLFAVGLMNLAWMGLVSLLILAEKVLPGGQRISWAVAGLLVVTGVLAFVGHLPGVVA